MKLAASLATNPRARRKLIALLAVVVLAVMALLGYQLWSSYHDALREAEVKTRNYAAIFDARLDATLRRADAELKALVRTVPVAALSRQSAPRYAGKLDADLDSRLNDFEELASLRVFDVNGDLFYTSDRAGSPSTNIADRSHFRQLRDDPHAGLVYSEVVNSRITGQPSVYLARALRDGRGAFRGVVVAGLDLAHFQKLFRSLDIGTHGIVAIYRSDTFALVVRWPPGDVNSNTLLPQNSPTRAALAPGVKLATIQITSAADGRVRIYSYRVLDRYPFFVSAGLASDDVLAGWRTRALEVGLSSLLLLGLLALLLLRLWRAQAQQARALTHLTESEARFRVLFEQAAVGVALVDTATGRFLRVNRKFADILGYGPDEFLRLDFLSITHPDDVSVHRAGMERLVAGTATEFAVEKRYLRKDGSVVQANLTVSQLRIPGQTARHHIVALEDITERKRVEESRRESEEKLRGLFELSPLGIALTDMSGRYVEFNEAFQKICGYPAEELKTLDYWTLTPKKYEADEVRQLESLERTGYYGPYEKEYVRKDGSPVPLRLNGMLITGNDGRKYIWSIVEDITDRKAAELAAARAHTRVETILRTASDGIHVLNSDGLLIEANDAFLDMLGYDRAAIGRLRVSAWDAQDEEEFIRKRNRALLDTTQTMVFETRHKRSDGRMIDVEISACGIEIEGQSFIYASSRDITERKRAEEQRRALEEQLRQAQKMEALGTLAGGIAHDFNNILSAIIGNLELAAQDIGAQHPAQLSLREIRNASHRARELVGQILTFSRQQQPARVVVDLCAVVQESLGMLRPAAPAGVELVTAFSSGAAAVLADRTQLHQVLINLCTNAWQAMEGRVGRIDIRVESLRVDEALAAVSPDLHPGRYIRLSVTDNGKGMDAATAARVFEPFFTTKASGEGTGLGLAVVHGIVRAHDGAVVLETRPGAGAKFSLYFPAVDTVPEAPAAPASDPLRGHGQEILYLDDEQALVFLASRMLERLGYRVAGFTAPQEALQAFRENPRRYAIAVVDNNMPGASGLEVAAEMLRLNPELPVALTSGYITDQTRAKANAVGVSAIIYKPNTVEELARTIHGLLSEPVAPEK